MDHCTLIDSPIVPRFGKQQPQSVDVRWEVGQWEPFRLLHAVGTLLRVICTRGLELRQRQWCSCVQVHVDLGRNIHISVAIFFLVFGCRLKCRSGEYANVGNYV